MQRVHLNAVLIVCSIKVGGGQLFDYQVVAIDDGSSDSSLQILTELSACNERLLVLHKDNGGAASARKYGIEQSESDFIAFCDSDDWVEPDYLLNMYEYLKRADADMLVSGITTKETLSKSGPYEYLIWKGDEIFKRFFEHIYLTGIMCGNLYRRFLFESLDWNLNMAIYEDGFLQWQILQRVKLLVKLQTTQYHYIQNCASQCHSTSLRKVHECKKILLDRIVSDCSQKGMEQFGEEAMRMRWKWFYGDLYSMLSSGQKLSDEKEIKHFVREYATKYLKTITRTGNRFRAIIAIYFPLLLQIAYRIKYRR